MTAVSSRRRTKVLQKPPKMLDPRIPFKNRWLAGIFAFLIPGAGHLYQGRWFKGIVCGACVLGTFFFGMDLGDWGVVYWKRDPLNMLNPFYAQLFVGLPALPSVIQSHRYQSRDNTDQTGIDAPLSAPFEGTLRVLDPTNGLSDGKLKGRISIQPEEHPADARAVSGEFSGTLIPRSGPEQERKLALGGVPRLGKPVSGDPERGIELDVVDVGIKPPRPIGRLQGNIPRSLLNRFEAPPDEEYLLELHRQLGKFHELAMTFTMIAGLLNILVILDAVEGPAYGYGDFEGKEGPKPDSTAVPAAGTGKQPSAVAAKSPERVVPK
jgi:TM2 domain-containing membrane protein YozV